jgi:hypothetical protein
MNICTRKQLWIIGLWVPLTTYEAESEWDAEEKPGILTSSRIKKNNVFKYDSRRNNNMQLNRNQQFALTAKLLQLFVAKTLLCCPTLHSWSRSPRFPFVNASTMGPAMVPKHLSKFVLILCSKALFECFVRMLCSNALSECFVRMLGSNSWFEYLVWMPCSIALFECFIRMLNPNALFECFIRMLNPNALFELLVRMIYSNTLFECFVRMFWIHRPFVLRSVLMLLLCWLILAIFNM